MNQNREKKPLLHARIFIPVNKLFWFIVVGPGSSKNIQWSGPAYPINKYIGCHAPLQSDAFITTSLLNTLYI